MSSDLLSVIGHYQRSIERSASDEARLLHCIDKLYRLPVTVEHLQATGVGKTVNSLRKYDKEVGIAAKALVAKWKAMVAAEEDDEPEPEEQTYNRRRSEGDESVHNNNNHQQQATTTSIRTDGNRNFSQNQSRHNGHSSHTQSRDKREQKNDERRSEKERLENEVRSKRNKHSSSHKSNYDESKYEKNENDKIYRRENEYKRHDDSSKRLKGNDLKLPELPENLNIEDESGEDDDEEKLIIDVTKEIKVKSDDSKRKTESRSSSKHKHHKHNDHHSPKDNEDKKNKHKEKDETRQTDKSHKDESSGEKNKRKEKEHSSKHKDNDNHRSKHKEKKQEKEKDESSSSHRSNGEHRHKSKDKDKRKDGEEDKLKEIKKEKHKRRNSDSDSKLSDVSPPKPKVPKVLVDGIDSSMGTSFEDALGMMFSPSKKNRSPKASTSSSSTTSSTFVKPYSKPAKESKQTPALLSSAVKLEPLDPSLVLDLPTISPNYKPMPLNQTVMDCVFSSSNKPAAPPPPRRMLTDEEAMSAGISSKTMRTKVYSGVKTGALLQVTSLFDLCIRVLQKNIDALEYTGGVPFEVLRPVLERANPPQLINFEEFNPYLMEDSDVLWQQHCLRFYRGKKRIEMETWREMFMRCKEEQDLKLSLLAENIKQSQKQIALPVRKTQLAYVDSMVKPPRNIQRKQEQYGTKGKLAATPAARVAALSGITPNVAKAGDNRLKIISNERDTAQATSHSRPKKAPLMQKTLQLMKGRFKR